MAPLRKRGGAKGAKANNQLKLGDLVLAKVKGFPAWPAKISKPEDWQRTPDPKKYFVHFFGTEEIAFVAPADIQPFTRDSKDKLLNRCKGKTVKYFSQAVKEICDIFEELENKSSDSFNGNEGQTFQSDANYMEMVDDGMTIDGPSGETSPSDILNHGPGLERCSQIQSEMESEDDIRDVSPHVNDHSSSFSTKTQAELCSNDATPPNVDSIYTSGAGHGTNSNTGTNIETNGQKSKKFAKASKNNHDCVIGNNKINSPAGISSTFSTSHITHTEFSATENTKDGTRRNMSHVSKNKATVGATNQESHDKIKKTKKFVIDEKHVALTDDLLKDVEGTGRKTKSELGPGKGIVLNNGVLHPTKKSKFLDDTPKKSQIYRNNDEVRKSMLNSKTKNRLSSKGDTNGSDPGVFGEEDVVPSTKRRRLVLEDVSSPTQISEKRTPESDIKPNIGENDSVKSGTQMPTKRSVVQICDNEEDKPKTPVQGRSTKVVDKISHTSMSIAVVTAAIQVSPSLRTSVHVKEYVPNSQKGFAEVDEGKFCHTPGKAEPENKSSEEILKKFVSPVKSPFDACSQTVEHSKVNKSLSKISGNVFQKKGQSGSSKATSTGNYDSANHSKNNALNDRSKAVFSGEKQKFTPKTASKSSTQVNDSAAVLRKPSDNSLLSSYSSERSEFRVDRTTALADSGNADPNKSMRHLIAVAQAKRKQAQSQNVAHENFFHTEIIGRSPGPVSTVQPTPMGTGVTVQTDDQSDPAEFEERTSSGHRPAGGSLSGGTEAAVARDAFEGMIETLSRTKESIGRATRHAIDCAKHGIASEVVELLTRKLENESSLHRRVDLFFLVDSITQCSHSQKGIAGASYIPTVQEALPRILGAAAPPGANARENRRQCLKVLKLWLERKILPDTLLQSYIEDIGSSNDDTSAGLSSKRPSRAERAVDDPIREMEGMFVDEYGSNAMFQLPGLLSSNVFEEEEDDDGILNFSHKEGSGKSILELNTAPGELETCSVTSIERRHCILEDVDGELEMEDVSGHPKDEKLLTGGGSYKAVQEDDDSIKKMDTASNNSNEASPFCEGSPPLPADSPPLTPPLPSSPPPPLSPSVVPPPPSTLSPLQPPPPPPLPPSLPPSQTYPLLAAGLSQVSFPQSSVPLNSRLGAHVDAAARGEMFSQQSSSFLPTAREASGFSSSRTVELAHETYTNPQGSQSKQQFQNGNVAFPSRTFQPLMVAQTAASQFQYPNPAMLQNPYPPLYGLTKPPNGPRRYSADEQWRLPSNEFGSESQRGAWISNGRTQLSTGPPFVPEGYFRPSMERPPTINVGFQPTSQNIVPAGAPGHSGSLIMPSHNSWRPAK
ncbi:hypothetical protein R6Q57_007570 [Mikania cordata]